jgi:hypothetical protein
MVLPALVLFSAAMLLGILPRLFWPGVDWLHTAGSVASIGVMTVVMIRQIRSRRSLRRGA